MTDPVMLVFRGGTLHGKKQPRLMFGFLVGVVMEPVYEPDPKTGASNYRNITHRQLYVRSPKLDHDGALGYDLKEVEVAR